MNEEKHPSEEELKQKSRSVIEIVLLSLLWIMLIVLSFYTYYAVPILIFISWWVIAWLLKLLKKDSGDGSGYDQDF